MDDIIRCFHCPMLFYGFPSVLYFVMFDKGSDERHDTLMALPMMRLILCKDTDKNLIHVVIRLKFVIFVAI